MRTFQVTPWVTGPWRGWEISRPSVSWAWAKGGRTHLDGVWCEEEGNGSERTRRDCENLMALAGILESERGLGRQRSVREDRETLEHLFSRVIH